MQQVVVNKQDLIEILRKNRKKHREDFNEALTTYQAARRSELREWADRLEKSEDIDEESKLQKPVSHVDDYDQIIAMLDMSVEHSIPLSRNEFRQYVQDQWDWKGDFDSVSTFYKSAAFQRR